MKPVSSDKSSVKKSDYNDEENIRYKLNMDYFSNMNKLEKPKVSNKFTTTIIPQNENSSDSDVRYMFPTVIVKPLNINSVQRKQKQKSKIKVNFWSNKPPERLHKKNKTKRRHTLAVTNQEPVKPKSSVKVRKRVSFLPSPLFTENHIPMVTVPDDLTIQLNEEEANDLGEDLNHAFINDTNTKLSNSSKSKTDQTSPKISKRYRHNDDSENRRHNCENELEFFSKYVVQKLRRMETNQRIYSENLINTVLMLGQLGKLNGKSKIGDA